MINSQLVVKKISHITNIGPVTIGYISIKSQLIIYHTNKKNISHTNRSLMDIRGINRMSKVIIYSNRMKHVEPPTGRLKCERRTF